MASAYPGGLDTFAINKADGTATPTDHPTHHNDLADAVNKIEAELGVSPSGGFATVAARLGQTVEAFIDTIPASPNALDDEFNDSSITGWTAQHIGTAPTWAELADGRLYVTATGNGIKAQLKAVPAGDWVIACKVAAFTSATGNFAKPCGMILAEGTTAQAVTYFGYQTPAVPAVTRWLGTDWDSFSAETVISVQARAPLYLRITRATATYTFEFSNDGQTWITVFSSTITYTPTTIGIGTNVDTLATPQGAAFDWFRRIS